MLHPGQRSATDANLANDDAVLLDSVCGDVQPSGDVGYGMPMTVTPQT